MKFLKNTFVTGLLLALSVVATDYFTSVANHQDMSTNAMIVAAGIAVIGFLGRYLSGNTNTQVAMIGSALLTIVPLLTDGKVEWKLLIATFMVKLIGLLTEGAASEKPKNKSQSIYNARM